MGLDTKIYANHSLQIPAKSQEVIDLLLNSWNGKSKIAEGAEIENANQVSEFRSSAILLNSSLINFEFERFNQISIDTNFKFVSSIKLYSKTICFSPFGIGRNATNMIANFMDNPLGFYHDQESINIISENWNCLKSFVSFMTLKIGGTQLLYIKER